MPSVQPLIPGGVLGAVRWASKKAAGSTRNGRKSGGNRLGVKCGDGKLSRSIVSYVHHEFISCMSIVILYANVDVYRL